MVKENHPTIVLNFVPGRCTGLFQPCDVEMQRVFKHSLKCSYHSDVAQEMLQQLAHNENLVIDKCVAIMRDWSITWMWDAFKTVGKSIIVKKVRKKKNEQHILNHDCRHSRCVVFANLTCHMRALLAFLHETNCES